MRDKKHRFPRRLLLACTWLAILALFPLFSTSRLLRRALTSDSTEDYEKDETGFISPELTPKDSTSPYSLNCGCPASCGAAALTKKINGLPFSCKERIEYLMTTYNDPQLKACSAAVQSGACGLECDPNQCTEVNGLSNSQPGQKGHYDQSVGVNHLEKSFLQPSFYGSSTKFDCGCPKTCSYVALSQKAANLGFTCRERIEYLMSTHHNTHEEACFAASNGEVAACGSECNPDLCHKGTDTKMVELTAGHVGRLKVMVIATVPRDEKHAVALWTELECLSGGLDLVILSSPDWSRNLTEQIASQGRTRLGLNVDTRYYRNDRYDVGLWCDALHDIRGKFKGNRGSVEYESIILINDSIFAMRPFTGIQDRLAQSHGRLDLVGLSYSYTPEGHFWLERYLRHTLCL